MIPCRRPSTCRRPAEDLSIVIVQFSSSIFCLKIFYVFPLMKTLLLTPGSRRDPRQHPGPRPPLHLPPLLRLRQVLQASRLDRLPAAAQEERGQDALLTTTTPRELSTSPPRPLPPRRWCCRRRMPCHRRHRHNKLWAKP